MRILLQFPEGLKRIALAKAREYEARGHEVLLSASACYGACDLALDEAKALKADKIVHFGHGRFLKADPGIEVEYVPYSIDADIPKLASVLPYLEGRDAIALATTIQHIHQLGDMRALLESHGKRVLIGRGERCSEAGQILGCDAGALRAVEREADAIVFVGEGMFHALALETGKPAFSVNPYDGTVKNLAADIGRLKKRRKGAIAKALVSKSFGILLSTKPGQLNLAGALWARDELRRRGFECAILAANELEPSSVANFMAFDCLVNTACPRMADDSEEWGRPILNLGMLREALALMDAGAQEKDGGPGSNV